MQIPTRQSANLPSNNVRPSTTKRASPPSTSHGDPQQEPVAPAPVARPRPPPTHASSRSPPPGFDPSPCAPPPSSNPSPLFGFSDTHVRLLRHRALFAFRVLLGAAVEVHLVASDERYAGVLDCIDPDDWSIVLKRTTRLGRRPCPSTHDGQDGRTVVFRRDQVAHVVADGAVEASDRRVRPGRTAGPTDVPTDRAIGHHAAEHLYGRELAVATAWLDPALETSALEDDASPCPLRPRGAGWNQFHANATRFGVTATYDENVYTTRLDRSKISPAQALAAATVARAIERQAAAGNRHVQDERGQTGRYGQDVDDEGRYSSVDRARRPTLRPSSGTTPRPSSGTHTTRATETLPRPATPGRHSSRTRVVHEPRSFSEAVTGQSSVSATMRDEQEQGKDIRGASSDVHEGLHDQTQATRASEDKASLGTTGSTTPAARPAFQDLKKGLNPHAKVFKLSASAASFTPSGTTVPFVPGQQSTASRGRSTSLAGPMPYLHDGTGYPLPGHDAWMYPGQDGGGRAVPPFGYAASPMGLAGVPLVYPPLIHPQSMRIMSGPTSGCGYQPQGYDPRGYYAPPNSNWCPPYAGRTLVSPPLPPMPNESHSLVNEAADDVVPRQFAAPVEPPSASEQA